MALSLVSELGIRNNTSFYHTNDGFYFHKYKDVGGATYYRCTERYCDARGILRDQFELRCGHNHDPCPEFVLYNRQRRILVNGAASLNAYDARQLFNDGRISAFPELLTYERLRASIERGRLSNLPQEPLSLSLFNDILMNPIFQAILCTTSNAGETLYGGSRRSDDGSIAILLMSRRCCEVLKIVPSLYAFNLTLPIRDSPNTCQIHVIGTVLDDYSVPLAFILLEKDNLPAYISGLSLLRDNLTAWHFTTVVCHNDCDVGDAYRLVFAVYIDFSLDDYILEIGKLAKNLLPTSPLWDEETIHLLHLCCGLPMVPQNLLHFAINFLKTEIQKSSDELVQHTFNLILINIDLQWMRSPLKGPKFSVSGNWERTSDAMETERNKILNHIPNNGIGLYTLLKNLKRMEAQSGAQLSLMSTGRPRQRSHSLAQDAEIVTLTNMLVRMYGDLSPVLQNLMKVTSAKKWHILLSSLQ